MCGMCGNCSGSAPGTRTTDGAGGQGIKPLPNVEETDRYITSRLLVAGAERTDVFSPEAVDYIFRCSDGIPRNINNLCDNALLAGYAAGVFLADHRHRAFGQQPQEGLKAL